MTPEPVALLEANGRVLAEQVLADRPYPPFPRSARDGFAVRAADVPGELRVTGEGRAGEAFFGGRRTGRGGRDYDRGSSAVRRRRGSDDRAYQALGRSRANRSYRCQWRK